MRTHVASLMLVTVLFTAACGDDDAKPADTAGADSADSAGGDSDAATDSAPGDSTSDSDASDSDTVPGDADTAEAGVILTGTSYAPETGVEGGTVVIGDWQEATQFNPYYIGQVTEANVASAVWAPLMRLTHDLRYAPDLAADLPTLANGGVKVPGTGGDAMTVTWTLKPGLKWSDGEPLTCDDFAYAWEWVLHPDNVGVITNGWDSIKAFECASDTVMVLHFDKVFSAYIEFIATPLPRHYLERIPMEDQVNGAGFRPDEVAELPVSGAFSFESVTPASELRLVRNVHYHGFASERAAYLDGLVWKWYGDPDALIAAFKAGEVDFATDLQDGDLPKLLGEGFDEEISAIPAFLYEFLRPNWSADGCSQNPALADRGPGCPMADPAMRKALALAIDKNEINNRLLGGTVQVANTNISPMAWYFADQPPVTHDAAGARALLEAAGWVDADRDGVREKDGLRAKIELCTTTRQVRIDTLALIVAWLADVGIEAIANPVSPGDIFADYNEATADTPCALARGNFDVAEHAFSSALEPLGNFVTYHSSQFQPNGGNDAQVDDPEIDAALERVRDSVDFEAVKAAMADFQRLYIEKTVEVPLYYRKTVELVSPRLGNFFANPSQAGPAWNSVDWFLRAE